MTESQRIAGGGMACSRSLIISTSLESCTVGNVAIYIHKDKDMQPCDVDI